MIAGCSCRNPSHIKSVFCSVSCLLDNDENDVIFGCNSQEEVRNTPLLNKEVMDAVQGLAVTALIETIAVSQLA